MTALPLRPALAPTLAVLTSTAETNLDVAHALAVGIFETDGVRCAVCRGEGHNGERCGRCGYVGCYPCDADCSSGYWHFEDDPAEAFKSLIARGVLPDEWAGDVRRAWVCGECKGVGAATRHSSAGSMLGVCHRCTGTGRRHVVPTIPELVAWASLGVPAIRRAEELALHGARVLTIYPPVVVWRVAPLTPIPRDTMLWQVERQRKLCAIFDTEAPCDALYEMGIAWFYADDHAVTITVPPIGQMSP